MGLEGYERWYLFINPSECCERFFPLASNCPYENDPQTGYYWEIYQPDWPIGATDWPVFYNHSFYPDLQSGTCVNGTDYPAWSKFFIAIICIDILSIVHGSHFHIINLYINSGGD